MVQQPQLQGTNIPAARTGAFEHKESDPSAFEHFFKTDYRSIVSTLMHAGASLQDAEDAINEAMALAAGRFATLDKPAAWVRKVALRRYVRSAERRLEGRRREEEAHESSARNSVDDAGLRLLVREILRNLPPKQAVIMALTIDGYPPREIAKLLGDSPDGVRSNLRYARQAMAAALDKGGWNA